MKNLSAAILLTALWGCAPTCGHGARPSFDRIAIALVMTNGKSGVAGVRIEDATAVREEDGDVRLVPCDGSASIHIINSNPPPILTDGERHQYPSFKAKSAVVRLVDGDAIEIQMENVILLGPDHSTSALIDTLSLRLPMERSGG